TRNDRIRPGTIRSRRNPALRRARRTRRRGARVIMSKPTAKTDLALPVLEVGTRVRIPVPSYELRLRSNTGTVVAPDEYDGYYVVRLDEPATYYPGDGTSEEVT